MLTRRRFGQLAIGAGTALSSAHLSAPALAQAKPKVVVIGGGPGGATAARYIAKDSSGAIEVTLVEPTANFVTCFHSNLYLGGFKTLPNTFANGSEWSSDISPNPVVVITVLEK